MVLLNLAFDIFNVKFTAPEQVVSSVKFDVKFHKNSVALPYPDVEFLKIPFINNAQVNLPSLKHNSTKKALVVWVSNNNEKIFEQVTGGFIK